MIHGVEKYRMSILKSEEREKSNLGRGKEISEPPPKRWRKKSSKSAKEEERQIQKKKKFKKKRMTI